MNPNNKTLDENIDDILASTESDLVKKKLFLRLVADDRLQFAKIWLRVEDKHGPKWIENIKKTARHEIEKSGFAEELEEV